MYRPVININRLWQPILSLLLVSSLVACGYHLRGAVTLPPEMQTTWIQGSSSSSLVRDLRRNLMASKIKVVSEKTEGAATLSITRDTISRRILSIGSDGKAREFMLLYEVDYQLKGADGKPVHDLQKVRLQRSYLYDPNDVLAAGQEDATLRREMVRDMAGLILRRLSAQAS
ncbi:MAG TPA: lipoprotein B transmembrane [Gammaproteobacteria bacterium]|nr:lipoprotein B transmembrane [Gammaproteobacteria bacterium]